MQNISPIDSLQTMPYQDGDVRIEGMKAFLAKKATRSTDVPLPTLSKRGVQRRVLSTLDTKKVPTAEVSQQDRSLRKTTQGESRPATAALRKTTKETEKPTPRKTTSVSVGENNSHLGTATLRKTTQDRQPEKLTPRKTSSISETEEAQQRAKNRTTCIMSVMDLDDQNNPITKQIPAAKPQVLDINEETSNKNGHFRAAAATLEVDSVSSSPNSIPRRTTALELDKPMSRRGTTVDVSTPRRGTTHSVSAPATLEVDSSVEKKPVSQGGIKGLLARFLKWLS